MRPIDSSYDRNAATATEILLAALRRAHTVETPVTGSVIVDGREIEPSVWDQMAMAWDGTADGLEDLGWEEAAEAMRKETTMTHAEITSAVREIAGACWDDREDRTSPLADQIRAVAAIAPAGTDGDLTDEDRHELRRLADAAVRRIVDADGRARRLASEAE